MYILYSIYCAFSVVTLTLALYCLKVHFHYSRRNNSMFPLFLLLTSLVIISIGQLLTLWNCSIAVGIIITQFTAVLISMAFIMFIQQSKANILWKTAKITMILIAEVIPIAAYVAIYYSMDIVRYTYDEQFCTFEILSPNIYLQVFNAFFIGGYQFIIFVYLFVQSLKSLKFLQRQSERYPFFSYAIYETTICPLMICVLIMPYFACWNLIIDNEDIKLTIIHVVNISSQFGLLICVFTYGINPTLQKVQTIRTLYQFRTQLQVQFQQNLLEGSGLSYDQTTSREIKMNFYKLHDIMLPLGFITYGGPLAHINVLKERFKEYISADEFTELFTLCQTLPGPTSTQMVIAIGTLLTQSCLGGLIAFLYFSIPSATVMLLFGLYLPDYQSDVMDTILNGFKYAAIAVILEAAYKLSVGVLKGKFLAFLWIASAIITFFWQSSLICLSLIGLGGILHFIVMKCSTQEQIVFDEAQQDEDNVSFKFSNPLLGYKSLILYVATFIGLIYVQNLNEYLYMAAGFFKTGSLVIGGGHVVLPMLQVELKQYLTIDQFWRGFALVSCMPGPMFNIAIYIGALQGGIKMAFLAEFFMFLPGFYTIFGLLPYWRKYRSYRGIKAILQGIGAVAVGFIISAVMHLIQDSLQKEIIWPLSIAYLSVIALYFQAPVPLVIIAAGGLNLAFEYLK